MNREEKAIATALAEYLAVVGAQNLSIASDAGHVMPFIPPHRPNPNELRAKLSTGGVTFGEDEYEVIVTVKKRVGYIE